jgi:hypothetical protein
VQSARRVIQDYHQEQSLYQKTTCYLKKGNAHKITNDRARMRSELDEVVGGGQRHPHVANLREYYGNEDDERKVAPVVWSKYPSREDPAHDEDELAGYTRRQRAG